MKTNFYKLTVAVLLCFSTVLTFAQPGVIDPTFNSGDIGFGNGEAARGEVYSSAIQNDGKIIIAGDFTSYNGTSIKRIARLNVDGTLDTSFNPGTGPDDYIKSVAIQSDGKIIIGGDFINYNGTSIEFIARLNSNGTLDLTFNPAGALNNTIRTIAIQSDGKIIIGGEFTSYNGTSRNRIARLNSNGTLDLTFNPGTGVSGGVRTSAIQSDGKIIIAGNFYSYNGTSITNTARLNSNGTLDATFNPGTGANGDIYSTTIQSDGKIIIGGDFSSYNGITSNGIARLNSNGTIDATFNSGTGTYSFGVGRVRTAVIQSDGKIIIGGDFSSYNGTNRNKIARLNASGTLDLTFNPADYTVISYDWINSATIQSDGKIIIGGTFIRYLKPEGVNGIARLNSDGTFDKTFNSGTGANDEVYTSAIQNDGKIIIGGSFNYCNGENYDRIARLNSDGTIDPSFNIGGSFANGGVGTIAIQNDGKIIIAGGFNTYNGTSRNYIARLNTDGTLDLTFNPGIGVSGGGINTIAIQNDGKIIIGGGFSSYSGTSTDKLARLNSDGTIDTTFVTSFVQGSGFVSEIYSIAIQSDGKIIVGGSLRATSFSNWGFVRLNNDGTLDLTFNSTGTSVNGEIILTQVLSNGKIIISGNYGSVNGVSVGDIVRLNSDGTLDGTFDSGNGTNGSINSINIQSNGKIIIGGRFSNYNGTNRNGIARLNADGTIDAAFNPGTGIHGTSQYFYTTSTIYTTAIQNDGKIIIGGEFTSYDGTGRNRIARILGHCSAMTNTITLSNDTLTANQTGATYQWLDCNNNNAIILGATLQSFTPTVSGNYAVALIVDSCVDTSACLNVCVTPNAPTNSSTNTSICSGNSTILTVSNNNSGQLGWYSSASGGNHLGSGSSFVTPTLNTSTTFYVQDSTCKASLRTAITVTVIQAPNAPTVTSNNLYVCSGNTATLTASGVYNNLSWYTAATGGTYLASGASYTTQALISTSTFYLQDSNTCFASTRTPITITVTPLPNIATSLASNNITITATQTGATYQWINCTGNTIITGATNQSYTATANGNYAVVVTKNGCVDTSACVTISVIGIESYTNNQQISIYPNPNKGAFTINAPENAQVAVYNVLGEMVYSVKTNSTQTVIDLTKMNTGVYFVKTTIDNIQHVNRIVKQ